MLIIRLSNKPKNEVFWSTCLAGDEEKYKTKKEQQADALADAQKKAKAEYEKAKKDAEKAQKEAAQKAKDAEKKARP